MALHIWARTHLASLDLVREEFANVYHMETHPLTGSVRTMPGGYGRQERKTQDFNVDKHNACCFCTKVLDPSFINDDLSKFENYITMFHYGKKTIRFAWFMCCALRPESRPVQPFSKSGWNTFDAFFQRADFLARRDVKMCGAGRNGALSIVRTCGDSQR